MLRHDKFLEQLAKLKQLKIWQALRQEYGSVLIFTAVAIPILLGLTGIAYDVGNLYMHKARLQNMADAAALAGARAFADSQANANEEDRDKVDQKITVTSYKPSLTYSVNDIDDDDKRKRNHGMDTSPHPHADEEADKYIYNNLNNLGNDVSTDLYSHYALLSKEINPRTFYRVGLTEKVDLHFLPIIRGIGKKQEVGVESIVLLYEDKGEEIPDTVFSNLFTYNGKLSAQANNGNTVMTTFEGQMYYTGDMDASDFEVNGNEPHLYADTSQNKKNDPKKHSTTIDLAQYINFFSDKVKQAKGQKACVELDMSNEIERKKLFINNNKNVAKNINTLKNPSNNKNYNDSDKDEYNDLYEKQEKDQYENLMYTISYPDEFNITKEFTFSIDERYGDDDEKNYLRYYSIDDRGDNSSDDNRNYSIDDPRNKLYCFKYDLTDGPTIRVPSYMTEQIIDADGFPYTDPDTSRTYQYYVVDGSKDRIYYSIDTDKNNKHYWVYFVTTNKMVIKDAYYNTDGVSTNGDPKSPNFALYPWMKKDTDDAMGTHFKYSTKNLKDEDYRLINFRAFKDEKFTNPTPRNLILNANVFHLINNNQSTYNSVTELIFEEKNALKGHGNTNEPIYIFDETGNELKITVNESNERPVVIIHTGTSPITVIINRYKTFNATIYAPNATAVITPRKETTFKGNIVANNISVKKEALDSSSTFIQDNHLKNDTDLYGKILQYAESDNSGEAQLFSNPSNSRQPPSNSFNSSWENWYNYVEAKEPGTAQKWFNEDLNRNQQIAFWRSWDAAKRPQNEQHYEQWDNYGPYKNWYLGDNTVTPNTPPAWLENWYFKDWANSNNGPKYDDILDAMNNVDIEHVFDTKVRLINPSLEANPFKT